MRTDITDLRPTIIPKSDQLNADQLIVGPMTVTVTDVRVGNSDEQPISVHYEGENGRPFKPCKTMRRVLIFAWGADGREWVGKSMTLYTDPQVRFGGAEVGGIRISHMSDIDRDINISLAATKGKKALHTIHRIEPKPMRTERHDNMVADLELVASESGQVAFKRAWNKLPEFDRAAIGTTERDRMLALGKQHDDNPPTTTEEA